jgi:D-tyrosyl-tRNA(Tyr) deacylase
MRAVLQRVSSASVTAHLDSKPTVTGSIGRGLVVLLGITHSDTTAEADFLLDKIVHVRIFSDEAGKMNRSLLDAGGALLVVSQFTLYGDCRKGRRPSFDAAAPADTARALYEYFVEAARQRCSVPVETGVFQAHMEVALVNDGPVTLILETTESAQ